MKISIFSHYKPWQKYLIFFLLVVILFQNIFIALTHSLHYDERCYIGAGKYVFETKNIKAAAARARKALGELGKLAKTRRAEIQEKKNNL